MYLRQTHHSNSHNKHQNNYQKVNTGSKLNNHQQNNELVMMGNNKQLLDVNKR